MVLLKLQGALEACGGLIKQIAGPAPRISDSVDLGQGQIIYILNKFPGDADAAGPHTTL